MRALITLDGSIFAAQFVEDVYFALRDLKLLWVVRPCLWLELKVMGDSGECAVVFYRRHVRILLQSM